MENTSETNTNVNTNVNENKLDINDIKANMFEQSNIFLKNNSYPENNNSNDINSESLNNVDNLESLDDSESHHNNSKRPLDDPEEYNHLSSICAAFMNYHIDSLREVAKMERDFNSIPERHKKLMKYDYHERIKKLKEAIKLNYSLLLKIISPYSTSMFKTFKNEKNEIFFERLMVPLKDIVKMRSTLKLFIRDWAKEVKIILKN
jgi:hypothetical protein